MAERFLIAKLMGLFVVVYIVAYLLWMQVDSYYQFALAYTAQSVMNYQVDFQMDAVRLTDEGQAFFKMSSTVIHQVEGVGPFKPWLKRTVESMDAITFNVPLLLSMVLTPPLFFRKGLQTRIALEVLLIVVALHWVTFYFYVLERFHMTEFLKPLVEIYVIPPEEWVRYIRVFFSKYVMRFEPFLVGVYVWGRLSGEGKISISAWKS